MRHYLLRFCLLVICLVTCAFLSYADDEEWDWGWDKMEDLVYSPRYFGVNAFPIPELVGADLSRRWEVEVRGEYHTMTGDQTKDIYTRLYIPVVKGVVGVNVSWVFQEWYKTSTEVRDERNAVEVEQPVACRGDVVFNFYFQALRNERWMDIVVSANLKTASGGRLCDARYTDAAAYWFDANVGRTLWKRVDGNASIRVQGLVGFYCWMTNDSKNRQNDAFCYGLGLQGVYRGFTLDCDYSGIRGYCDNGDRPMVIRTKLNYEYKKNIFSFRYKHGMKDNLYDSFSLGYIRCF